MMRASQDLRQNQIGIWHLPLILDAQAFVMAVPQETQAATDRLLYLKESQISTKRLEIKRRYEFIFWEKIAIESRIVSRNPPTKDHNNIAPDYLPF
jgi:hypothetical protein